MLCQHMLLDPTTSEHMIRTDQPDSHVAHYKLFCLPAPAAQLFFEPRWNEGTGGFFVGDDGWCVVGVFAIEQFKIAVHFSETLLGSNVVKVPIPFRGHLNQGQVNSFFSIV